MGIVAAAWLGTVGVAQAALLAVPHPVAGEIRVDGADALQRWSLVAAFPRPASAMPDGRIAGALSGEWERLTLAGRLAVHARAEGSAAQLPDDTLVRRERASGLSAGFDYGRPGFGAWARWTTRVDDRREELRDAASGERHLATLDRSTASRLAVGVRRELSLPFGGRLAAAYEQASLAANVQGDAPGHAGSRHALLGTTALRWSQPLAADLTATAGWTRGEPEGHGLVVRDPRNGLALPVLAASLAATEARVGLAWRAPLGIDASAGAFRASAAQELAFTSGDAWLLGERPTLRDGVRLGLRASPWGMADLDLEATLLRARFADRGREPIPGAARAFGTAGATFRRLPAGWTARLSVSYLGPRDAIADEAPQARSTTRVNAQVQRKLARNTRVILDVFNVFDHRVAEVDAFAAARSGLQPGAGETFMLRPTESRTVVLRLRTTF